MLTERRRRKKKKLKQYKTLRHSAGRVKTQKLGQQENPFETTQGHNLSQNKIPEIGPILGNDTGPTLGEILHSKIHFSLCNVLVYVEIPAEYCFTL